METVVRDGKFFTVGDDSAELFRYKRNDIIFNAQQTKEIFENGKISSGKRRGTVYASGTAYAFGSYGNTRRFGALLGFTDSGSHGSGKLNGIGNLKKPPKKPSGGGGGGGSGEEEDEFLEKFDWIEIAIDRIERAISTLDLKASSVYKSWSSRNKNLRSEMTKIREEIDLQQKGYDRYIQEANSVGLSEEWAKRVRDGTIDISTIKDEELAKKIKEYQEW